MAKGKANIINLDDWIDMAGGLLKKMTLEDLQFQIRHRKPSRIIIYAERRGYSYYGKVLIPKKYFDKYRP